MNLFDASALLVFLQDEPGTDVVTRQLEQGGAVSAANWSEVAQKTAAGGGDWSLARVLVQSYGVEVVPVTRADAEAAAALWRRGDGLSLADRLCLATAERLDAVVWTADREWGTAGRIQQVR